MFCKHCGKEIDENYRACPYCGAQVGDNREYQNYYQQAYWAQQPQYQEKKQNTYALVGFILSFFVSVVGLIFSILGYQEAKKLGGEGKSFALAGIIISSVSIGLTLIVVIVTISVYINTIPLLY